MLLLISADKWERSGDSERIRSEADGRPQGGDWPDVLHLSRRLSQSTDKGMSALRLHCVSEKTSHVVICC